MKNKTSAARGGKKPAQSPALQPSGKADTRRVASLAAKAAFGGAAHPLDKISLSPASLHPAADRILAALAEWVSEGNFPRVGTLMPDSETETFGEAVKKYNAACLAAEGAASAAMPTACPPVVAINEHQRESSLIVYGNGSGVFAVDLVHDREHVVKRLASVGTSAHPGAVVIPLSQVLKAPALLALVERLAWSADGFIEMVGAAREIVGESVEGVSFVSRAVVWLSENALDGVFTREELFAKSTAEVLQMMDSHYPGGWSAFLAAPV